MGDDWIDQIGPYPYRAHSIAAVSRSGNISASEHGAVPSNATWYLWVDGEEIAGFAPAVDGDGAEDIQQLLERAADQFLGFAADPKH